MQEDRGRARPGHLCGPASVPRASMQLELGIMARSSNRSERTAGWKRAEAGDEAWREGNGRELDGSDQDRLSFLLMFYVNI